MSALDIEGGAFEDREADAALFDAIRSTVQWTDARRLIEIDCHINDPQFAETVVAAYRDIA